MRKAAAGLLTILLICPAVLPAADHVVSPAELRAEVRDAARARERNAAKLRGFLGSEAARTAMARAELNAAKVDRAIASLSDQELARLAARADSIEKDFAAGRLTNSQVTYIILGAILIIVVAIVA